MEVAQSPADAQTFKKVLSGKTDQGCRRECQGTFPYYFYLCLVFVG